MFRNKITIIISIIFFSLANSVFAFVQDYIPNDPNIIYQNYFNLINIKPSWSNDIKVNKEIIVAVLDSGIDLDHPDLENSLWTNIDEIPNDGLDNDNNSYIDDYHGWDFIDSDQIPEPEIDKDYDFTAVNHGTVIAGIIAAESNNSGIVGIAPQAKIMSLRILNEKGAGNTLVLSQAINYALENGADIINLSLVGDAYNDDLKEAIIKAYNQGIVIIAASGNEESSGLNLNNNPQYPVCDIDNINRVFGVTALDQQKKLTSFSNYGQECIDISAPGTGFYSTVYHNNNDPKFSKYYSASWSGTSVAAPIVSATAALIKMNYPHLRPDTIYNILAASANDLRASDPLNYKYLGSGLIDIGGALNLAKEYVNQEIKLVLAPEAGSQPEILILDELGNLQSSFLAYDSNFHGGVNIAIGDVNSDGKDEIITAPASSAPPEIRVFKGSGLKYKFLAYDSSISKGVKITVGDINDDKWLEIITVPNDETPTIKLFNFKGRLKGQFLAYSKHLKTGIDILAQDFSGDKKPELLTLPDQGSTALLKIYDSGGLEKDSFYLREIDDKNGYNFSVLVD